MFETVKVANKAARLRSWCHSPGLPGSSPVSTRSSCTSTPRTSYYGSDNASLGLEDRPTSCNTNKEDSRSVCMHIQEELVFTVILTVHVLSSAIWNTVKGNL